MADEIKKEEVTTSQGEKIPSMDDMKEELEASFKTQGRAKRDDMGQWEKVQTDLDEKTNVEVEITEAVKSGVTTTLEGLRAFIPVSKLSLTHVTDEEMKDYVGKRVVACVITVDPEKNRLVLSVRDVLRDEQEKAKAEKAAAIEVGAIMDGKVESLKDYGAFVDLGDGVTGLLHVSQISNKRVKSPAAVLKEGQDVKVKVIALKDGKISLSMKALEEAHEEVKEKKERENFHENFKSDAAVTTSLGALMRQKGIKL